MCRRIVEPMRWERHGFVGVVVVLGFVVRGFLGVGLECLRKSASAEEGEAEKARDVGADDVFLLGNLFQ